MKIIAEILLIISLGLIIVGIIILLLNMFIQNQCYQLTQNEYYQSTICENYWNDTDWEAVKKYRKVGQ